MKLIEQDIYIVMTYRPPSYNTEDNESLTNFLQEFCNSKEVLLLGDFNLPSLQWTDEDSTAGYLLPTDRLFLDVFTDIGLSQVVTESTNFPSGNIIDLCLLTHPERLGSVTIKPPLPQCSHGLVNVKYTFQMTVPEPSSITRRMWTRGNYRLIANRIHDFDWDSEFDGMGVQEMYDRLRCIIIALCKRYVPESDRDCSKPPWTLNPPRFLLEKRRVYLSILKRLGCLREGTILQP